MKYFSLFAATVALLVASCTQQPPTVTPGKEAILRSKNWRINGGTITVKKPNGKDTSLQYLSYIDSCYSDNYLKFDSMHYGGVYTGAAKCNAADPEYFNFTWRLNPNGQYIDLYDGFNMIFAVSQYIEPYHFDTLSMSPFELDTLVGRLDTIPGFIKQFIVLDTIRELKFSRYKIPGYDLYGAEISDLTEVSFKLRFSFKTTRLDSTGWRAGAPENMSPAVVNDTADYELILGSF